MQKRNIKISKRKLDTFKRKLVKKKRNLDLKIKRIKGFLRSESHIAKNKIIFMTKRSIKENIYSIPIKHLQDIESVESKGISDTIKVSRKVLKVGKGIDATNSFINKRKYNRLKRKNTNIKSKDKKKLKLKVNKNSTLKNKKFKVMKNDCLKLKEKQKFKTFKNTFNNGIKTKTVAIKNKTLKVKNNVAKAKKFKVKKKAYLKVKEKLKFKTTKSTSSRAIKTKKVAIKNKTLKVKNDVVKTKFKKFKVKKKVYLKVKEKLKFKSFKNTFSNATKRSKATIRNKKSRKTLKVKTNVLKPNKYIIRSKNKVLKNKSSIANIQTNKPKDTYYKSQREIISKRYGKEYLDKLDKEKLNSTYKSKSKKVLNDNSKNKNSIKTKKYDVKGKNETHGFNNKRLKLKSNKTKAISKKGKYKTKLLRKKLSKKAMFSKYINPIAIIKKLGASILKVLGSKIILIAIAIIIILLLFVVVSQVQMENSTIVSYPLVSEADIIFLEEELLKLDEEENVEFDNYLKELKDTYDKVILSDNSNSNIIISDYSEYLVFLAVVTEQNIKRNSTSTMKTIHEQSFEYDYIVETYIEIVEIVKYDENGDRYIEKEEVTRKKAIVTLTLFDFEEMFNILEFNDDEIELASHMIKQDFSDLYPDITFATNNGDGLTNEEIEQILNDIPTTSSKRKKLIEVSLPLVNYTVYEWGGKGVVNGDAVNKPRGLDCSGFVGWAYSKANITNRLLGTGTWHQIDRTVAINKDELEVGDLGFQNLGNSSTNHVGIYMGNGKWIESYGGHGVGLTTGRAFSYYRKVEF